MDRVLPRVPMRQWAITFPARVRYHLASDPKLASEALREILMTIFTWQRERARLLGERPSRANSNGAVTMVQRFNSALELSLHFHSLIPDGIFVHDDDNDLDARPRFVQIDPPNNDEVATLLSTAWWCSRWRRTRRWTMGISSGASERDPIQRLTSTARAGLVPPWRRGSPAEKGALARPAK